MKKRITALALAFVMVLGTAALAAGGSKTISVSPMEMSINGQSVTPTKSDGTAAEVFAYDGATYVPLRYLSELLGIEVVWDKDHPNTATLVNVPGFTAPTGTYADGVYTAAGTGMGGDVPVTVTVEGGKIAKIDIGTHSETPGISDPAIAQIPQAIIDAQKPQVDVASGASITSRAIMEAVEKALSGGSGESATVAIPFDKPDVIVVGAGIAGLSASVKAAELGANVLVLEQAARVGGSGNLAGGSIVGVGTKIEAENKLEDSPELLYADFERLGGKGNFNPEAAMTFAQNCGRAVDWLDEVIGIDFGKRTPTYGSYEPLNVPRVHYAVPESGVVEDSSGKGASGFVKGLMNKLDEYIAAGNACLLLKTEATDIILENNVITGVTAKDAAGNEVTYTAPSIILATGGYGHNESWLKEYNFTNVATSAPATANGSGYDFARKAGAVFDGMDFCTAYGGCIPVTGFDKSLTINTYTFKDAIWVDLNGKRFTDETTADSKVKSDSWTQVKDNVVFSVFPASAKTADNSPLLGGDWAKLEELAAEGKYVFKADTVEELAALAGIDAAGLAATVKQYNKDCAAGKDSAFGRTNALTAMEGPLYAVYTIPYVLITSGGPRVNGSAQMLRADGSAIEGAFLAGEIIGMGNVCGHTTIGGIGHGNCATWGIIAAENAVARAKG